MQALGEARCGPLGIARDDAIGRARVRTENWNCFGAGTALFCYLDRDVPPPRWADTGIYLQTVMLLLRAEGLHNCTQEAWAKYHHSVAEVICPPPERPVRPGTHKPARRGRKRLGERFHDRSGAGEGVGRSPARAGPRRLR